MLFYFLLYLISFVICFSLCLTYPCLFIVLLLFTAPRFVYIPRPTLFDNKGSTSTLTQIITISCSKPILLSYDIILETNLVINYVYNEALLTSIFIIICFLSMHFDHFFCCLGKLNSFKTPIHHWLIHMCILMFNNLMSSLTNYTTFTVNLLTLLFFKIVSIYPVNKFKNNSS